MPKLKFNLVVDNGESSVTVYDGAKTHMANATHPNWEKILKGVLADDAAVIDLFDIAEALKRRRLSERVTVANGKLYFDHDEVHDTLSEQVIRILGESGDVNPWVRFMENLYTNPNQHSREHLYRHLKTQSFTITHNGLFVGYKYVNVHPKHGYQSTHAGPAIVNGEVHKSGMVPNAIGSIIEMPRADVTFDPGRGCSSGLHVGNWRYVSAQRFKLEVHVNPRDVVSVPTDSRDAKIRVCRYVVVREVTEPYKEAVITAEARVGVKAAPKPVASAAKEAAYRGPGNRPWPSTVKAAAKDSITKAKRFRYPNHIEWSAVVRKAKSQKKGLVKFVQKTTDWKLIDGRSGQDRKDWSL